MLPYSLGKYWQAWSFVINSGGDFITVINLSRQISHTAAEVAAAWKAV